MLVDPGLMDVDGGIVMVAREFRKLGRYVAVTEMLTDIG
jgi:hypothetical protein